MTSVKEFRVDEPASATDLGRGAFVFTDDYSVFDWGKMPDEIPQKGASLCVMGAFNFERLEDAGIPTHYEGVVADGESVSLQTALDDTPPEAMAIALTQVPNLPFADGTYDYDSFHAAAGENYLVPLEVVFRNRVPVGSSLRSRSTPRDHGLSLDAWPDDGVDLDDPIVEFSTKYEEQDRYLSREDADDIAGVAGIAELESIARAVNRLLTEQAESTGLVHEDGKIECLYYDGEIRVADVVGTFDENRFSIDGQHVSKEVIRQYHKHTQPAWVESVGEAKDRAHTAGIADWRSLCDDEPEPLDRHVIEGVRDLYCAGTNSYVGSTVFDAPPLADAVERVQNLS